MQSTAGREANGLPALAFPAAVCYTGLTIAAKECTNHMKMIFLVDGDNNIGTGLQGIDLLSENDTVLVFYGKGQPLSGVQKLCAGTRAQVQYLESVRGGKNSIDFQIITELGVLVGRGEADFAYVISQDKGYEAAMSALRARYADTFREVALRPSIQSCVQAAFLLRSATREDLAAALVREYGDVQGSMAFAHLETLFTPAQPAEPAPRQRKRPAAAKTARQDTPEISPEPPTEKPAEKPSDKATRSRRSGRRRKKPAAEEVE